MPFARVRYSQGEFSVRVARTFFHRARGVLGEKDPFPLLLWNRRAVHGFGLVSPLDLWFLRGDLVVLKTAVLKPLRVSFFLLARHTLELPRGVFPPPSPGERIDLMWEGEGG
jgi:uncharacterized membrane protein (UPF0127 family)